MNRRIFMAIAVIACGLTTGCSDVGSTAAAGRATAKAEQYFTKWQTDDWEGVLDLCSPDFFKQTPKDEWRDYLAEIRKRFGDYKSHRLVSMASQTSVINGTQHRIVALLYEVEYADARSQDSFTMTCDDGEEAQIVGHNIHSNDLLKPTGN